MTLQTARADDALAHAPNAHARSRAPQLTNSRQLVPAFINDWLILPPLVAELCWIG